MRLRLPGLRWTKAALVVFGGGLLLGFVVVVIGDHPRLERVASALMALALLGLLPALFADGRGFALVGRVAAHFRRPPAKKPARARSTGNRRKTAPKPAGKARKSTRPARRGKR